MNKEKTTKKFKTHGNLYALVTTFISEIMDRIIF
ncbi:hypothetical protein UAY_00317 [Enterococcus moraviensis ATCC BAA-383]|uniref:Uncharacterized protein n=1 Tax=Enterococcus moraviensis ATCC BAA-383 TaxID=1158609 RepID=R2RDB0_9ENTE|nr:hypothetical protein UAY_00317 [Enterococcus moraviensis ATCC BAA-383]EOT65317.1 hypothetical protein I586_03051 [Enterococcus moraviensis ATCC BAA-383]